MIVRLRFNVWRAHGMGTFFVYARGFSIGSHYTITHNFERQPPGWFVVELKVQRKEYD